MQRFIGRFFPQSSDEEDEDEFNFWDQENDKSPDLDDDAVGDVTVEAFKYIDDTALFIAAPLALAARHITTSKTVEVLDGTVLDEAFAILSLNSEKINMKINNKKTQLLVIGTRNGCHTTDELGVQGGQAIQAVGTLKLVGFTFGEDPGAGAHVMELRKKFRRRVWMLQHLRQAGIRGRTLFRLYCSYIRSVLEYCSPVFHSILNQGQAEALERLHRQAVRICFRYEKDVEAIMQRESIESLMERRARRCDKFVRKLARNPRFRDAWLAPRPESGHNLWTQRV